MIDLYRAFLEAVRLKGIDVFVIPGPPLSASGEAYCGIDGEAYRDEDNEGVQSYHINIRGSVNSPLWLYILLHEVAHHVLGHTRGWTSQPVWSQEYAADMWALKFIKTCQPYAYDICERSAKENVRRHLQPMIDWQIFHHIDLTVADWAGCKVPVSYRAELIEALESIGPSHKVMDAEHTNLRAEIVSDGEINF